MTSAPPLLSIHPLTTTVHVTDAGSRLHVRVTHPVYALQQDARDSFRSAFPRHGQRLWLHELSCWSIPRAAWRVLEAWAVGQGYRVAWAGDEGDEETA